MVLHAQYFAKAANKNNSVGHYIRYANINVFSEPNFSVYGQKITMVKKVLVKHLLQLR